MTFNKESGAGGVVGRFQVVGISVWVSRSVWDGAAHFYDLLRPDFGCRPHFGLRIRIQTMAEEPRPNFERFLMITEDMWFLILDLKMVSILLKSLRAWTWGKMWKCGKVNLLSQVSLLADNDSGTYMFAPRLFQRKLTSWKGITIRNLLRTFFFRIGFLAAFPSLCIRIWLKNE